MENNNQSIDGNIRNFNKLHATNYEFAMSALVNFTIIISNLDYFEPIIVS